MFAPLQDPSSGKASRNGLSSLRQGDAGRTSFAGRCPVCERAAGAGNRFLFWFLNENYSSVETLEELTRAGGLCSFHGRRVSLDPAAPSPLTFAYSVLCRRLFPPVSRDASRRAAGRGGGSFRPAQGRCPACRGGDEAAERAAILVAADLETACTEENAEPRTLCFPHLQACVSRLTEPALGELLQRQETAFLRALEGVCASSTFNWSGGAGAGKGEDGPLAYALSFAAGEDGGFPPPAPPRTAPSPDRDPVAEFEASLSAESGCPVCLEMERAWTEWVEWLGREVGRGGQAGELLPICPDHLWSTFRIGNRSLSSAAVRRAIDLMLQKVRCALEKEEEPGEARSPGFLPRLRAFAPQARRRRAAVRDMIRRPIPCPLCNRLAIARDRSLELLFALLEGASGRKAFSAGAGLCFRHYLRAMEMAPPGRIASVIAEVASAAVARLAWELEESLRKDAWAFRAEAGGTERTAWRRAVAWFGGSCPARDP